KGKTYDDTFGMHFGTKHGSLVQTCVQREKGSKVPMDFVLKLDANGRVLESFIVVPSSLANCIMNSLEKDTWPRPPFAPFYGHMHLEITE
ncbi:MAG: hypothetical protein HY075_09065, partial [Deltaproteobacteria bacterium]|nr:hypothetical protein [Deltaproteobacteria bacterium]